MYAEFFGNHFELPPAPSEEPESDSFLFYHDTQGNQVGVETVSISNGELNASFQAMDSSGVDVLRPLIPSSSLTLEGRDWALGMSFHTTERDAYGRPKRINGVRFARGLAEDETDARLSGEGTEELDYLRQGGYEEFILNYEPATGLLATILHTEEKGGLRTKEIHRNVFDGEGRRTGCVRSMLKETDTVTGRETYDITEVKIYELHTSGWREATYAGFQDGLIPVHLEVGTSTPPFDQVDTWYMRPSLPQEQLPYQVATEPIETILTERSGNNGGRRTATLPSWIPKAAAYYIAAQSLSLEEAAEYPYIIEAQNTEILGREEAYRKLLSLSSPDSICEFINSLRTRDSVVLQSRNIPAPLIRDMMQRSSPNEGGGTIGQLTGLQKVGVIAAMHPAFARESIVTINEYESRQDRELLDWLLGWLAVDENWLYGAVLTLRGRLSPSAQAGFGYLIMEEDGKSND